MFFKLPAKARETSERSISIRSRKAERKGIRFNIGYIKRRANMCAHVCACRSATCNSNAVNGEEDSSAASREFFNAADRKFSFG